MNIIHINNTDLPGRRFNGYDMHLSLNAMGHNSKQLVITKESGEPTVIPVLCPRDKLVRASISALENTLGVNTLINPTGNMLRNHPDFQAADVVHYHLIHNNLISILDMPVLTSLKPSVWTIHDPWVFTGGCVHPLSCEGWKRECGECEQNPTLMNPSRRTRDMLRLKRTAFAKVDADIVVASEFSARFVRESGIFGDKVRLRCIPFGLDVNQYTKKSSGEARATLNIPPDNFVIAFRSEANPLKGCSFIFEALQSIRLCNITLLTLGGGTIPDSFHAQTHTVELGWQNDAETLLNFYAACDMFLMPSLAESFGLMAIEAMASGKPVVCFEKTALVDTTFAPDCGLAVPYGDSQALKNAILKLLVDKSERFYRGNLGKKLASEHYNYDAYLSKHLELYAKAFSCST